MFSKQNLSKSLQCWIFISGNTLQLLYLILLLVFATSSLATPQSASLNLQPGLNLLGISTAPDRSLTTFELIEQLGGTAKINRIERLNPQTQRQEICGFDESNAVVGNICDLLLVNGEGLMVYAKTSLVFEFSVDTDCPVHNLQPGVNLVAFPCVISNQNSHVLIAQLGGPETVAALQTFDPVTGRWLSTVYNSSGEIVGAIFPIEPGRAYLAHLQREIVSIPVDTDKDGITDNIENILGTDPNLADTDGDGLDDGTEIAGGTDPLNIDTDGDGISDTNEINIHNTDPLKADSDGDGFTDSEELAAGSNPLDSADIPPAPGANLTKIFSSPANGEGDVAVTRETIISFSHALAQNSVIDDSNLYAEFAGNKLAARIHVNSDKTTATLFYQEILPPSARIKVTLVGDALLDINGDAIDGNDDGIAGGTAVINFDTLALSSVPGTEICGRVFASELVPGDSGMSTNVPLEGVTITADGLEDTVKAVTDQFGNFRLKNAPAGRFFVHIDGRTANNGVPVGAYYPFVGKTWESIAGEEVNIGEIYLPQIQPETLQTVSDTKETQISFAPSVLTDFPEFTGVQLTVPSGALFSDDGTTGGMVGIAPVSADRLPGDLPPELDTRLVITVQTDGATNFNEPVPICFPNLPDPVTGEVRAPGDKTGLVSFNHDAGRFEVVGSMTVTEDGSLVCSDPGQGVRAPGWHFIQRLINWFGGVLENYFGSADDVGLAPTDPSQQPGAGLEPGSSSIDRPPSAPGSGLGRGVSTPNTDNPNDTDGSPGSKEPDAPKPGSSGGLGVKPNSDNDKRNPGSGQDSEPVYLFSGEFYDTPTDFRITGRGLDFIWARKYRSQIGANTLQGNGWDFSYNIFIQTVGQDVLVNDGNSRQDRYLLQSDGSWSRPEFFRRLTKNADDSYTLSFENTGFWKFNALDKSPEAGRITRIEDRNGNALQFAYDAQGRLKTITDSLNRNITIGYNTDGLISSVTDFIGRAVVYNYYQDGDAKGGTGDLKSVTSPVVSGTSNKNDFPAGKTTTYTYTTGFADERLNHNLLSITDGRRNDPNDPTFGNTPYLVNIYATTTDPSNLNFDRIVRQVWGGDIIDMVYVRQIPNSIRKIATSPLIPQDDPVLKTIINDRSGNVTEYFWDNRNRNVKLREYSGRADPTQPTTELSNRPTAKLRNNDPNFFETKFEFNDDSLLTRKIFPKGNIKEYVYESDLNPSANPRTRSNIRIRRILPGSHKPAGDQAFIQEFFEYDPVFNFVAKHIDGNGNTTTYQYDNQGNHIHTQHRIASVIDDFEYNTFGQLTAYIHPDNGSNHRRRDQYSYFDSGIQRGYRQQSIIDVGNFNLTTTYEYDAVGNMIKVTDPRGHDTQYEVNQLNQIVRITNREVEEGSNIRYQKDIFYDANNNVIRQDIQNIDDQGNLQPNTHFSHSYQYEILDYITRMTEEVEEGKNIVTEFQYDKNRNRTLKRYGEAVNGNQPTNTINYVYDERDLLFKSIRAQGDADQSSSSFDYDPNQNLIKRSIGLEDSAPRIHQTIFDGYDRAVKQIDPMGNEATLTYDSNHNITDSLVNGEQIDVAGNAGNSRLYQTSLVYDALDRLIREEKAFFDTATQQALADGLSTTQLFYNDNSQIIRHVDDNNHQTLINYDTANRRSLVSDPKNNTVSYSFDANSNVVVLTEVDKSDLGHADETFTTQFDYDNLDRLIKRVDNVGNTHEYAYDSRNNKTTAIDALRPNNTTDQGNITRYQYDGINRLVATLRELTDDGTGTGISSGAIITTQQWDDSSRLKVQGDDNGNDTVYSYDALNRKISTTYADNTEHQYSYDVHHNVVSMLDANGSTTSSSFDLLNRMIGRSITLGTNVANDISFETYQYDGLSRLVQGEDDDSVVKRSYDSLSRVTLEILNNQTTTAVYDGVGNQLSCRYPGGRIISNRYDELNRKQTISDQNALLANYQYIGSSRTEQRDYANNTRSDWVYDGVKRITRTTHTLAPDTSATVFDDRAYVWDRMYNKTQRQNLLAGGLTHQYHYDSIYRLTQSEKALGANIPSVIDYTLDGVGNRTQVVGGSQAGIYTLDNTQPNPADHQTNQYTSTAFDQRQYDLNGNLTTFDSGLASERNLAYDYRNQMVSFTNNATGVVASYAYDVFGRRIGKTVNGNTTLYLYDGWRVIEEQNQSNTAQVTYVYGRYIDEVLTMQRGGQDYFYHADDLFNVMTVTDGVGDVAERYDYGDYGEPEISGATGNGLSQTAIGNAYLFNGRRYDDETGFYYYRTRYLEPLSGRFTTRDTIGIWGDLVNLGNGYSYVGGNPFSNFDPYGISKQSNSGCDLKCLRDLYNANAQEKNKSVPEDFKKNEDSILKKAKDATKMAKNITKAAEVLSEEKGLFSTNSLKSASKGLGVLSIALGYHEVIEAGYRGEYAKAYSEYVKASVKAVGGVFGGAGGAAVCSPGVVIAAACGFVGANVASTAVNNVWEGITDGIGYVYYGGAKVIEYIND